MKWWYCGPVKRAELLVKDPELVTTNDEQKSNILKYPPSEMRDSPRLLPTSLAAGEGVQYFLIARVPSATPAGSYRGVARVLSEEDVIARVDLQIEVLSFALEEAMLTYSIYYRGGKLGAKPSEFALVDSEYKTRQQMELDVADMLDHGIRHIFGYTSVDNILHLRQKFNTGGPVWTLYPNSPDADDSDYIHWART